MNMERTMIEFAKVYLNRNEPWMLDDAGYSTKTKLRAFAELQQEYQDEVNRNKNYADR